MEIWFSESTSNIVGAIMGSGFGVLLGLLGAFAGIYGSKGKLKRLILSSAIILLFIGAIILLIGLIALLSKQPYHVWYPFVLVGGIVVFVQLPSYSFIRKRFLQIELKKMEIKDS